MVSHEGPAIIFIILLDLLMFYQIFRSPQVKRSAIISNKHGIYEVPHELSNDVKLRKFWKVRKISKLYIIKHRLRMNFLQHAQLYNYIARLIIHDIIFDCITVKII